MLARLHNICVFFLPPLIATDVENQVYENKGVKKFAELYEYIAILFCFRQDLVRDVGF